MSSKRCERQEAESQAAEVAYPDGSEQDGGAPEPISELLDNLACDLIGLCLDDLADGREVWPTLSFLTSDDPDAEAECMTFSEDTLEQCLDAAYEEVRGRSGQVTAYAIAYEGSIYEDEGAPAEDALIVEYGEKGLSSGYSLYVPYRLGKGKHGFWSGEPLAAGEEPLLLD